MLFPVHFSSDTMTIQKKRSIEMRTNLYYIFHLSLSLPEADFYTHMMAKELSSAQLIFVAIPQIWNFSSCKIFMFYYFAKKNFRSFGHAPTTNFQAPIISNRTMKLGIFCHVVFRLKSNIVRIYSVCALHSIVQAQLSQYYTNEHCKKTWKADISEYLITCCPMIANLNTYIFINCKCNSL